MEQHKVLVISENETDHLLLSACLGRARPARFIVESARSLERPLEAMMDPEVDVVIMAHGPQTE